MKRIPTHSILHRYLNRHGVVCERVNSECHGATDKDAREIFDGHVEFAETAWKKGMTWNGVPVRILGMTLTNAAGEQLAAWTHQVEMAVAS